MRRLPTKFEQEVLEKNELTWNDDLKEYERYVQWPCSNYELAAICLEWLMRNNIIEFNHLYNTKNEKHFKIRLKKEMSTSETTCECIFEATRQCASEQNIKKRLKQKHLNQEDK